MRPYYDEGGVTIYHADARDVLPLADVLITDPPYGVGFSGYLGDDDPRIGPEVVASFLPLVKRGAVFTGTRVCHDYPKPTDMGGVYCSAAAGGGPWGFSCFNPVLFYGANPTIHLGRRPTVITSNAAADPNGHPCPKPLPWMRWLVGLASLPGETVLDPFAGSGTTLVAAREYGRQAIGIEREEAYCEIAARRLAQGVLPFDAPALVEDARLAI